METVKQMSWMFVKDNENTVYDYNTSVDHKLNFHGFHYFEKHQNNQKSDLNWSDIWSEEIWMLYGMANMTPFECNIWYFRFQMNISRLIEAKW